MLRQERRDLRPDSGEKRVEFSSAQITDSQVNNPGRRIRHHDSIREVDVFANNDVLIQPRVFPKIGVRKFSSPDPYNE
jgi:hypothetical protein